MAEMKTKDEAYEIIDACENSDLPGMSYEEGVISALLWMIGDINETPIEIEGK